MKRLLVCVLLVGVVGCGEKEQVVQKPSGESEQVTQQPSGESPQEVSPSSPQSNANLTTCPDCEGKVSKRAAACPHCGAPLTEQASPPEPARPDVPRPGSQPAGQSGNGQPPTVGKTIVNGIGMKLTLIPAGEIQMGSPDSEPDRDDDETQHLVKISKPFYLGVYEVTQQQYEKVMGARPWRGKGFVKEGSDYPAVYIIHDDAVEFCRRLSKQEGVEYRLPTQAEWEYACRAGTTTAYSFGDDASKLGQYAWYGKNAWDIGEKYAHRVGRKLPNRWGLYDMHGNVWEWSQDWYAPYGSEKVVSDPVGPAQGAARVLRGGSFSASTLFVRSAFRFKVQPDFRAYFLGFRAVRTSAATTLEVATVKKQMTPAQLALGDPVVNSIDMKLTLIPAGEFQMGSPDAEPDRKDDETRHLVRITKPFYLGVYEVTRLQYEMVMGARPWQGKMFVKEGADYPAVYINHDDAVEFCRRFSKLEGVEYRLPTEAEWEYACRAGTTTAYSFGGDEAKLGQYAWYDKNAWDIGEEYAHRVGQKLPNRWGLYDMHGNVTEWCQDWYAPYGSEKVGVDPVGPAQGDDRVLRGGSFAGRSANNHSAVRSHIQPGSRLTLFGFRAARTYKVSP